MKKSTESGKSSKASIKRRTPGKSRKPPATAEAPPLEPQVFEPGARLDLQPDGSPFYLPSLRPREGDPAVDPILVSYPIARPQIWGGDLLLKRAAPPSLIAAGGRSIYSHAAMAALWEDHLMAVEMVQFIGGRAVLLSNHVAALPGRWDVFRANPDGRWPFERTKAVDEMIRLTGTRYGWWNLLCASTRHLAIVRLFVRPPTDDKEDGSPPFCSQAVARATVAAGVDPVPFLSDAATEPGDLARSPFYKYLFTLTT